MRFTKFIEIMRIEKVPVYAHWSLLCVTAVVLIGAVQRPAEMLSLCGSYYALILFHECGHLFAARRLGCEVISIRLYPVFGVTHFEEPWSQLDLAGIAWAGVGAQMLIAVPVFLWLKFFGFTKFDAVNVALGMFSYYSVLIAVLNLIPSPPLDGAIAWRIFPALLRRTRSRAMPERKYRKY
jgi:membrane-associated protease RseP (regulator of RpoE activity)